MKRFFYLVMLLTILGSCQKDEIQPSANPASIRPDDLVSNQVNQPIFEGNEDIQPLEAEDQGTEKIASSSILNATNASQIPSQMFAVNPIYKIWYYHYIQPDNVSCSWTSYVNCINCIVKAKYNYSYPTAISTVRYRCQNSYPDVQQNGASHILALEWHIGKYDRGYVNYSRKSPTNRWYATREMLAHINTNHSPFVVRSSMNSIGHYRVVFSIDWKQTESASIVYYTDCYPTQSNGNSFQNNLRSMSLYQFLNTMTVGASCYNMLFMWPKSY